MKRVIGMVLGVGYLGLVGYSYSMAQAGWDAGHSDVGFWFTVIAGFLAIAAVALFVGTWIHTQPDGS